MGGKNQSVGTRVFGTFFLLSKAIFNRFVSNTPWHIILPRKEILRKNVTERGPLEYLDPPRETTLPRLPKKQTQEPLKSHWESDKVDLRKWLVTSFASSTPKQIQSIQRAYGAVVPRDLQELVSILKAWPSPRPSPHYNLRLRRNKRRMPAVGMFNGDVEVHKNPPIIRHPLDPFGGSRCVLFLVFFFFPIEALRRFGGLGSEASSGGSNPAASCSFGCFGLRKVWGVMGQARLLGSHGPERRQPERKTPFLGGEPPVVLKLEFLFCA